MIVKIAKPGDLLGLYATISGEKLEVTAETLPFGLRSDPVDCAEQFGSGKAGAFADGMDRRGAREQRHGAGEAYVDP